MPFGVSKVEFVISAILTLGLSIPILWDLDRRKEQRRQDYLRYKNIHEGQIKKCKPVDATEEKSQ